MFTGIIEEVGKCKNIRWEGDQSLRLTVSATKVLEDVHIGDSISVNGICLTVTSYDRTEFTVDVMPETVRRTDIQHFSVGTPVNLERAMAANGRFGGHIVQGHIDGRGVIAAITEQANAVLYTIRPESSELLEWMLPQGSVALDGVSLTLVAVQAEAFQVSLIPHTLSQTAFHSKQTGDRVNIECDILGKYVQRMLGRMSPGGWNPQGEMSHLTEDTLKQHGFI